MAEKLGIEDMEKVVLCPAKQAPLRTKFNEKRVSSALTSNLKSVMNVLKKRLA